MIARVLTLITPRAGVIFITYRELARRIVLTLYEVT
jgi:hypothetical protein